MSSLTVYKASAGSGKTFTLAVEYIKFLINNPESYRNILAVTFTNKATDEMKTRILSTLYGIAFSLADSDDYMAKIKKECNADEEAIRKTARLAVGLLIHNYDYFHVETIDTFFQSVLRNMARELDLSANLKVELNDTTVEEQAVDLLVEELDRKSPLFVWLMNFIMDNIDSNKSWNVINSIKTFGKMIFNDTYRNESRRLKEIFAEKDFSSNYKKKLMQQKTDALQELCKIRQDFFSYIERSGIATADFSGGESRGIHKYFDRLAGNDLDDKIFMPGTVVKHLADEEKWTTAKNPKHDVIVAAAKEYFIPLLERAEATRAKAKYVINSVDATLKNFNNLRLLSDIENKVREMNVEANRFLLSDTQHLLGLMVNDNDSPFIFEKIGTRLAHIMIDEFQDTSTVQWKNFLILLNECISHTHDREGQVNNLIVGDVKQSIYRWRSGDWQLLGNIQDFFPGRKLDIKDLDTNYRSSRNVVVFNNAFFRAAIESEAEREAKIDEQNAKKILAAYSDVKQKPSKLEKSGAVSVKLLANEKFDERMMQEIEATIDSLTRDHGIKQRDIAILLRKNKQMPAIANYFMEHRPDIKVVSNEAFMLDHSVAVNTLVTALRYLCDNENLIVKASLIKYYQRCVLKNSLTDAELLAGIGGTELLPEGLDGENAEELRACPLYDLAEKLLAMFQLDKMQQENAYIYAFFDYLSAYIKDLSADISGFLKLWDETLHKKSIQADSIDGVRMVSIHQSKGLQYDSVIVPFCNWMLENYTLKTYMWCAPAKAPYNELPLIPIEYSPRLMKSIYADDYKHEHMQNTIDNLNLLYVAFTRAKHNLFVIGKRDSSNTRSEMIQKCLEKLPELIKEAELEILEETKLEGFEEAELEGFDSGDDITFSYGSVKKSEDRKEAESKNVFLKHDISLNVPLSSYDVPVVFRQSNKSKDFVAENSNEETTPRQYIKTGNILHLVFSNIRTAADIPSVLDRFEAEGILYGDDLDRERLQNMLQDYISGNEMIADWFSPHWKLYNECTILSVDKDGSILDRRPDRVMRDGDRIVVIDFKFGREDSKYADQVRIYMNLLRHMGNKDVKGYLWYVKEHKITEVQ